MKNIVIYWSGTGNTLSIAAKIANDTNAIIKNVNEMDVNEALEYDTLILGCPAMGAEELEEEEFLPFFYELLNHITNQRIFLFGSYGWGDGEWMRNWQDELQSYGINLISDGLIVNGSVSDIDMEKYNDFISLI